MARRVENECAYCGEELELEFGIIGQDWKLYCSTECTHRGERLSRRETEQLMRVAIPSRHYVPLDKAA
ncbi:MAG: hypothetical protein SF097_24800 [Acidobacteriota bacterium]|nr:hypothetical protein [Acidobacteriota bacterium]